MNDTIFALSSGSSPAAIAVVRISGPRANSALEMLAGSLPEPRRAVLARLRRNRELLDRALILRFPGPGSATGEDLAELHLHGGRSVVAAVLAALGEMQGLRAAEPGEFTRRAFENGRIDLAEAEGLADLLQAETEVQRRAALALSGGSLSRQVEQWREHLLMLSAAVEAALDFADEGDVGEAALPDFNPLAHVLNAALARPPAERLKDGIRVVIAGPPNSGKSSLINALSGRDAAIVAPVPGTTRDVIEAPVALSGIPFLLVDTAGLRESDDAVEAIGIARARMKIGEADLLLWLGDPGEAPQGAIRLSPKWDVTPAHPGADLAISSATGKGIDALVALLIARASTLLPREGEISINARHRAALSECLGWIEEAAAAADLLVAAEALRLARVALDKITGRAGVEDMLNSLFGRFCIGK